MNNRKNQNSILVLATLGVYLGLVLVGATPQVLANAAMTRQFDVKDEIEVKDDLDTKPDRVTANPTEPGTSDIDHKITRSVERFIAKFKSVDSINSFCTSPEPNFDVKGLRWQTGSTTSSNNPNTHYPLDQIITITHLPRAGLDTLLATDAK